MKSEKTYEMKRKKLHPHFALSHNEKSISILIILHNGRSLIKWWLLVETEGESEKEEERGDGELE